ncbi:MAG: lysylphosphatidylglycerol synthase transmembrane domain-containing protein [Thermodesulfobacteriota bacterium]
MTIKKFISPKIIGFAILLWLFFKINIGQTAKIISSARPSMLLIALIFLSVSVFIKILRYQYILIQQDIRSPLLKTVQFSLAALYISFVTPGRIGEVSKAYFIHKVHGIPLNKPIAGSFMDRIFDVYALFIMALTGLAFLNPPGINTTPIFICILLIATVPFFFLIGRVRELFIKAVGYIQSKLTGSATWSDGVRFFFLKSTAF